MERALPKGGITRRIFPSLDPQCTAHSVLPAEGQCSARGAELSCRLPQPRLREGQGWVTLSFQTCSFKMMVYNSSSPARAEE